MKCEWWQLCGDFPVKHHDFVVRSMTYIGYWKNSSVLMNSCSKATSFPNQLFLCCSELCVLYFLYFPVFHEIKKIMRAPYGLYCHLKSWTSGVFRKTGMNIMPLYMGMPCFRNLSWKSSSGLIWCVFFCYRQHDIRSEVCTSAKGMEFLLLFLQSEGSICCSGLDSNCKSIQT